MLTLNACIAAKSSPTRVSLSPMHACPSTSIASATFAAAALAAAAVASERSAVCDRDGLCARRM